MLSACRSWELAMPDVQKLEPYSVVRDPKSHEPVGVLRVIHGITDGYRAASLNDERVRCYPLGIRGTRGVSAVVAECLAVTSACTAYGIAPMQLAARGITVIQDDLWPDPQLVLVARVPDGTQDVQQLGAWSRLRALHKFVQSVEVLTGSIGFEPLLAWRTRGVLVHDGSLMVGPPPAHIDVIDQRDVALGRRRHVVREHDVATAVTLLGCSLWGWKWEWSDPKNPLAPATSGISQRGTPLPLALQALLDDLEADKLIRIQHVLSHLERSLTSLD